MQVNRWINPPSTSLDHKLKITRQKNLGENAVLDPDGHLARKNAGEIARLMMSKERSDGDIARLIEEKTANNNPIAMNIFTLYDIRGEAIKLIQKAWFFWRLIEEM